MATAVDSGRIMTPMAGFVNTDTRIHVEYDRGKEIPLAEEVVTQGLSKDLEAFYNKTNSPRDQAKALELLTSIRLGQEIRDSQPRPYTAMPSLGGRRDPYETTYHRDFPQKESSARAIRPMTSRGFQATHDLGGPIGETTYGNEYPQKPARPGTPVRSGSASGNRANKPHPLQSFMIWRFPAKTLPENKQPWSEELTDEKISQIRLLDILINNQCNKLSYSYPPLDTEVTRRRIYQLPEQVSDNT
ncbi:hypothetical protein KUTeg_024141 [Tegillarca granosa]|uniref:Uncharacterized protein n=1 Tax=Tegillarca granosa TaxID=220873 RepID=A0ABQ9E292_TEGGR|nr:hypothetical protein KUTeg_024141 [Tegillarca granosa]